MYNTMVRKKLLKLRVNIFFTIVRPQNFDFSGVLSLNQVLKMLEHSKQFMLLFKKKEPSKPSEIINEHNIVIITKQRRDGCQTLDIKIHNLKHRSRLNFMFAQRKSMHLCTYTRFTRRTTFINLIECKSMINRLNSRMKQFDTCMPKSVMPKGNLSKINKSLQRLMILGGRISSGIG